MKTELKTLKISDETHKLITMIKGELIAKSGDPKLTYDDAIYRLVKFWSEGSGKEGITSALKPYNFVRFRWWNKADLEKIANELGEKYYLEWSIGPRTEIEIDLRKAERDVLKVKADTLGAYLDIYKAVLYQREPAPFTTRDMELRKRVFELYTRDRPTPFPWQFLEEPKFVVAE